MRKTVCLIASLLYILSLNIYSQVPVSIEPIAKSTYNNGSMVNLQILGTTDTEVIALSNNYSSSFTPGYYYNLEIAIFNKSTGDFISKFQPVSKEYINKGSFATRVDLYHLGDRHFLVFFFSDKSKNSENKSGYYFQEIDVNGKLIGDPMQMNSSKSIRYDISNVDNVDYLVTYTFMGKGIDQIFKINSTPSLEEVELEDLKDDKEKYFRNLHNDFLIYPSDTDLTHRHYYFPLNTNGKKVLVEYTYYKSSGDSPYFYSYSFNTIAVSIPGLWQLILPRKGVWIKYESVGYPLLLEKNNKLYLFYNDHTNNFNTQTVDEDTKINFNVFKNDLICLMIDPSNGTFEKHNIQTYSTTKVRYFLKDHIINDDNSLTVVGFNSGDDKYTLFKFKLN